MNYQETIFSGFSCFVRYLSANVEDLLLSVSRFDYVTEIYHNIDISDGLTDERLEIYNGNT